MRPRHLNAVRVYLPYAVQDVYLPYAVQDVYLPYAVQDVYLPYAVQDVYLPYAVQDVLFFTESSEWMFPELVCGYYLVTIVLVSEH